MRLTDRGRALDAAVWKAGQEVEESWRGLFDSERWATFTDVLDGLNATED